MTTFISSARPADTDCSAELAEDHPYKKLLADARAADDADLERYKCVVQGKSKDGLPILFFAPRLGFANDLTLPQAQKDRELKRMMLYFIKIANSIVPGPYIMIYAHTPLTILSQQPIIYKYYKMLPREYKKNLLRLYIVHPNFLMRSFFEIGVRWFVSDKFYKKLHFVKTISELQDLVGINAVACPPLFFQNEDEDFSFMTEKAVEAAQKAHSKSLKKHGEVEEGPQILTYAPPLKDLFEPILGTTALIHRCCEYLRATGDGIKRKGLFRLSGDNVMLSAAKRRMKSGVLTHYHSIYIGEEDPRLYRQGSALRHSNDNSDGKFVPASLVITDVDTVANVLKVSWRLWADPVISLPIYTDLIAAATQHNENKDEVAWSAAIMTCQAAMPKEQAATLDHLMAFLAEVSQESATNNMDAENLARIFSPTFFQHFIDTKKDPSPGAVFAEVTLGAKILKRMIEMHMKDQVVSFNEKMLNRLTINGSAGRQKALSKIEMDIAAAAAEDSDSDSDSS